MVIVTSYPQSVALKKFGDKGIRTPGLTGAIRALYQLSYIPILVAAFYDQINYSEI